MIDPATIAAYFGLLLSSFLAATVLPLGSETVVVVMAAAGYCPAWILVTATAGNSLGAVFNYGAGAIGERVLQKRYGNAEPAALTGARRIIQRWGPPAMIFAWAPVIGDPLTLLAGLAGMPFGRFFFWMCLGKGLRYAALLFAAGRLLSLTPECAG